MSTIDDQKASWYLDYTSHLGYLPPGCRTQFASSVSSSKLADHVRFSADLGLAGVAYPWAVQKPEAEVKEVREALLETGLGSSHLALLPSEMVMTAPWIWADRSRKSIEELEARTVHAAEIAVSLDISILVALVTADRTRTFEDQLDDVAANLSFMAKIAADHGLTLDVEPMSDLQGSLVRTTAQAMDLIARADNPALGIVFDTGHVAAMPGDPVDLLEESFEHIHLMHLRDAPGRYEPGAGNFPIAEVCAAAVRRGYSGWFDLEHLWSDLSRPGEEVGIERWRELDVKIEELCSSEPR
jgi:hydroxypyruvate isomerase